MPAKKKKKKSAKGTKREGKRTSSDNKGADRKGKAASSKRRLRGVIPNKAKIRKLREERGWSQDDLAERTKCTKRTIQRAEEQGCRIDKFTLKEIADALNVPKDLLRVPDFTKTDDPGEWLTRAIRFDNEMNYGHAIEIGETVMQYLQSSDEASVEVCVRLASFYDHAREWEKALRLLADNIPIDKKNLADSTNKQIVWALYQRGINQRCLAEDLLRRTAGKSTPTTKSLLIQARSDLENVHRCLEEDKSAPLHQLGILLMLDKKYAAANKTFDKSLSSAAAIIQKNLSSDATVFVNVNNHYEGCAPLTIQRLIETLEVGKES